MRVRMERGRLARQPPGVSPGGIGARTAARDEPRLAGGTPALLDDAQEVVDVYADPGERDEMGTALKPAMKDLDGINDPDPLRNPDFSAYNRVRVEKCSYDRYMGRVAYQSPAGFFSETAPGGAVLNFNLYQQGYLIMQEAIEAFTPGLAYTTWSLDGGGNVVSSQETLPPLADAEKVLFVGHSDGAHGLFHNIDNLAALLAAIPGFTGDVRALFDANFLPSNENEPWFDSTTPGVNDAYSGVWSGQTVGTANTFTYDGAVNWPSSFVKRRYTSWGAVLDASCVAAHPAPDDWKCADRHHVLLNHIATPFFFREDFTDPNKEHTFNGFGNVVQWGDLGPYAHCGPFAQCPPILTVAEYRQRLEQQFQTMLDHSLYRSELATGADPSLGAGNFPTFFAWMPSCGHHDGSFSDGGFFDTEMTYLTYTESMSLFLRDFMSVGRTNLRGWYVDGWTDSLGNTMTTTNCP